MSKRDDSSKRGDIERCRRQQAGNTAVARLLWSVQFYFSFNNRPSCQQKFVVVEVAVKERAAAKEKSLLESCQMRISMTCRPLIDQVDPVLVFADERGDPDTISSPFLTARPADSPFTSSVYAL